MSPTVRGQPTGLAWVPPSWRGPLPDVSVRRHLPVRDGYVRVPLNLLFSSVPDLSIVVWAALKLSYDERPAELSYQDLADQFGMQELSPRAVQGRFTAAIKALVDSCWVARTRGANNAYTYLAVTPSKTSDRYAMLRRCDLALLRAKPMRGAEPVGPTQLGDFCRWQLECGQRGWTGEQLTTMAQRWNLSERQFRNRRARLMACNLNLIVSTPRTGYPDVVWLGELHDPHWQIPSEPELGGTAQQDPAVDQAADDITGTPATFGVSGVPSASDTPATFGVSPRQRVVSRPRQLLVSPYKEELTNCLPADLSDLGGASATPLASVTRDLGDAAPQAAPSRDFDNDPFGSPRGVASRLISEHRYLVQAQPHFRAAMMRRVVRAVSGGLDERHLARALARVVDYADRDDHCELVRLAVQQAWADQRGNTCPECAGDGRGVDGHAFACSARAAGTARDDEDPAAIQAAIVASLDAVRAARTAGSTVSIGDESSAGLGGVDTADDPLQPFLDEGVQPAVLDWATSSEEDLVQCLSVVLARLVAPQPTPERVRALQRAWVRTRPRVPPERWDALDLAALRLRQRLEQQPGQANSRVAS